MSARCRDHRCAGPGLLLALLSSACAPEVVVGTWSCPPYDAASAGAELQDKVLEAPWTTSFERGFCDYGRAGGFCYADDAASYTIVEAPVRSGRRAAAFTVNVDRLGDGAQTRCFLEGALPEDARYGAWLYLPTAAENAGNWNLMHFEGWTPAGLHPLWDVSIGSAEDGTLSLYLLDFLGGTFLRSDAPPAIPIGSWFQVELRIRRASDATGAVALYQDGALVLERTGIVTADTDFGQWYVGNLADALAPADYTLYVDDVTVRPAP